MELPGYVQVGRNTAYDHFSSLEANFNKVILVRRDILSLHEAAERLIQI